MKHKNKKANYTASHKTRTFHPREKVRYVLIMCAISILMPIGTYYGIRRQMATQGYAHTDIRLVGFELVIIATTLYMLFSWWRSR